MVLRDSVRLCDCKLAHFLSLSLTLCLQQLYNVECQTCHVDNTELYPMHRGTVPGRISRGKPCRTTGLTRSVAAEMCWCGARHWCAVRMVNCKALELSAEVSQHPCVAQNLFLSRRRISKTKFAFAFANIFQFANWIANFCIFRSEK